MKIKKVLSCMLCVCMLASIISTQKASAEDYVTTNASSESLPLLHADGSKILNANGEQITFRGTNLGGWLMQEGWLSPLGYGEIDHGLYTVSASSDNWGSNGELLPSYAIDTTSATSDGVTTVINNLTTYWQSNCPQQPGASWFRIELNKAHTFSRIVVETDAAHTCDYLRGGEVQVSNDGSTWWDVSDLEVTADSSSGVVTLDFSETTNQYIRILPTESSSNWWAIGNISVCTSDEYTVRTTLIRRFGEDATNELYSTFQDNWITESDIENIASMNMNFVRVPVYWMNFATSDGEIRTDENSGFEKLDQLIEWCTEYGIYVLIDFHGAPGGSNAWASCGQAGTIPTELYVNDDATTGSNENVEWNRTVTLNIWRAIANRYKDNTTVAAYGLLNEPVLTYAGYSGMSANDWSLQGNKYDFYNQIYNAVREIDTKHIVSFEEFGDWEIAEHFLTYTDICSNWSNFMFEKHPYDMGNAYNWNSQNSLAQNQINTLRNIQSTLNCPILVGEFCLYYFNDVWDSFLSGLNKNNISWTNWCYKVRGTIYESGGGNWGYYNTYTGDEPDILHDTSAAISSIWSNTQTASSFTENTPMINTVSKRADGSVANDYTEISRNDMSASASISSSSPNDPAANMLDGDYSTRWSTGVSQSAGQWVIVDLGEQTDVDRIEMVADAEKDSPQAFRIYVSTDGINYSTADLDNVFYTDSNGAKIYVAFGQKMVLQFAQTQNIRYIKIVLAENYSAAWWSVQEMKFYFEEYALYKDPSASVDDRVADLLSRMTLDEKVGQILQVERSSTTPDEITEHFIGSVLSGGGSNPDVNTSASWAEMVNEYQEAALSTRLGIPILYGVDAVHGNNNVENVTIFPHNIGLGAANDAELAESVGQTVAAEVRAAGVSWAFAPCLAAVQDYRWGRTYESFSEAISRVSYLGSSYLTGLQEGNSSDGFTQGSNVVATVKHYIGDGNTVEGDDQGNTEMSDDQLEYYINTYKQAIEKGAQAVMVSLTNYNGTKMHQQSHLITDVLKDQLSFEGIVISDWNGCYNLEADSYWAKIRLGLLAGIDMFMEPWYWKSLDDGGEDFIGVAKDLVSRTDNWAVPMSRLNDAVSRILKVKFEAGLFENPYADSSLLTQVGSTDNRSIAREAVSKSATLLKNDNHILPLTSQANTIAVIGEKADNIGYQCGGWTIAWQGSTDTDLTTGTTIYEGIAAVNGTANTVYSEDGTGISGCDLAIVVIGEEPYAEMNGDVGEDQPIKNLYLSDGDQTLLKNVAALNIPTIVIMLSGRPMDIDAYINDWDSFICAWLPGTEGEGIADVIFGSSDFTATLPVTWSINPSTESQNLNDADNIPLYPYGYGLTTRSTSSELPGIVECENYTDASLSAASYYTNELDGGLYVDSPANNTLSYDVSASASGSYQLSIRGKADASSAVQVYVDDILTATITIAAQTDWDNYSANLYLTEGNHEIKLITSGAVKLNKMEFLELAEDLSTSLISNGGFESSLSSSWDVTEDIGSNTVAVQSNEKYNGDNALCVSSIGSGNTVVMEQEITVTEAGNYTFSAKTQNTGGQDILYFYIQAGDSAEQIVEIPSNETDLWSYIEWNDIEVEDDNTVVIIGVKSVSQVDTSVIIDNISLKN